MASMISGPMPSPYATVTGTFFAVAMVVVKPSLLAMVGGALRSTPPSGSTPGRSRLR